MNILEVKDLRISFKEEKKSIFDKTVYTEVLKGISFSMEENEIVGLVGESGCLRQFVVMKFYIQIFYMKQLFH